MSIKERVQLKKEQEVENKKLADAMKKSLQTRK